MGFQRCISPAFITALNKLHESEAGNWWKAILEDHSVFVAMRDNRLNAYYRGCSLVEARLEGGEIITETHYQYLVKPNFKPYYIPARNGKVDLEKLNVESRFITDLSDLKSIKTAAKPYSGGEKEFISDVIAASHNVVDVEVALSKLSEIESDFSVNTQIHPEPVFFPRNSTTSRLDIATLCEVPHGVQIEFYEAKLFSNQEIRTRAGDAKVIEQLHGYEDLLNRYSPEIKESYRNMASDITKIEGISESRRA